VFRSEILEMESDVVAMMRREREKKNFSDAFGLVKRRREN
jgi:hypothetical protein